MISKTCISQIDHSTEDGKLLIASLAILSTELYTSNTPYEILDKVVKLGNKIYYQDQLEIIENRKRKINNIINVIKK